MKKSRLLLIVVICCRSTLLSAQTQKISDEGSNIPSEEYSSPLMMSGRKALPTLKKTEQKQNAVEVEQSERNREREITDPSVESSMIASAKREEDFGIIKAPEFSEHVQEFIKIIETARKTSEALSSEKQKQETLWKDATKAESNFIIAEKRLKNAERKVKKYDDKNEEFKSKNKNDKNSETRRLLLLYNQSLEEREWARVAFQARARLAKNSLLLAVTAATKMLSSDLVYEAFKAQLDLDGLNPKLSKERENIYQELNKIAKNIETTADPLSWSAVGINKERENFKEKFEAAEKAKKEALKADTEKDNFSYEDNAKETLKNLQCFKDQKEDEDSVCGNVQWEMECCFGEENYTNGDINSDLSDEEDDDIMNEKMAKKMADYEEMAEYAEDKFSKLYDLTEAEQAVKELYLNVEKHRNDIISQKEAAYRSELQQAQVMLKLINDHSTMEYFFQHQALGGIIDMDKYQQLSTLWSHSVDVVSTMKNSWEKVSQTVSDYQKALLNWGMSAVQLLMTFKNLSNPHEFLAPVKAADAEFIGRLWVGKNFQTRSNNPFCIVSEDKLRQYRAPSLKKYEVKDSNLAPLAKQYQPAFDKNVVLANFEWKASENGKWKGDSHLLITDIPTEKDLEIYQNSWLLRYPLTETVDSSRLK